MKRHVSLSSLLWSGLVLALAVPALGAKVPAAAEGDPGSKTFWLDTTSRKLLKIVETGPQMGGAVVTVELQN